MNELDIKEWQIVDACLELGYAELKLGNLAEATPYTKEIINKIENIRAKINAIPSY